MFVDDQQPACVQAVAAPVQPWHHGHDLPFVRCCGMLYGRLLGELHLRFGQVVDTSADGLAAPKHYLQAMQIDGDLNFSDRTPIREILANSPPGPVLRAAGGRTFSTGTKASPIKPMRRPRRRKLPLLLRL